MGEIIRLGLAHDNTQHTVCVCVCVCVQCVQNYNDSLSPYEELKGVEGSPKGEVGELLESAGKEKKDNC